MAAVQRCEKTYNRIRDELAKVIVGQNEVIEQVLVAMFARGHALLEGVPGLAKTLLINSVAESLRLSFIVNRPSREPGFMLEHREGAGRRVQYTTRSYAVDKPEGERY